MSEDLSPPLLSAARWARHWPEPDPSAARTVLAVGAAAAVAAASLPLDRAGVGWLITVVAATLALIVARVGNGPGHDSAPDRYGWAIATVALLGVGAVRAADWLFLLCVATATGTAALALTGGRSLRGIVAGYFAQPIAAFRALPWLAHGTSRLRRPPGTANIRIAATIGVSLVLLIVFGALFASADAAFADALSRIAPRLSPATVIRWVFVFVVATLVIGGAAFLRAAPPEMSRVDRATGRPVNRYEWVVPLGLLVLLFGGFVGVQLSTLFGGNRHVLETDGLTYAQYARGGFWQLSFVTALTLLVLAGAARWAPRTEPADRLLIRVVLGALTALTLVIVGSALHRMSLYADTYGLTRLRLLVACCEAWFGLVLLLVLVAGVRLRAPWLPRLAIAAGVLALLGLAAANPDGLIVEFNLRQTRVVDREYLAELSADAVPALVAADETCPLGRIGRRLSDAPDDWRGWNLGRQWARALVADDPLTLIGRCS